MPLILEGIVTTVNLAGDVNIAPMGPMVDRDVTELTLRPFRTATTYRNLKTVPEGVFHVTDDVELLAAAAIGRPVSPPLRPARVVRVSLLADACRWFEFRVIDCDDRDERTTLKCQVVARGEGRPFFGFNRAKHAVLEGAILATRLNILPREEIDREFARLQTIVEKTAGDSEWRAWTLLTDFLASARG